MKRYEKVWSSRVVKTCSDASRVVKTCSDEQQDTLHKVQAGSKRSNSQASEVTPATPYTPTHLELLPTICLHPQLPLQPSKAKPKQKQKRSPYLTKPYKPDPLSHTPKTESVNNRLQRHGRKPCIASFEKKMPFLQKRSTYIKPGTSWTARKKLKLVSHWGGSAPPDPPFESALRPP